MVSVPTDSIPFGGKTQFSFKVSGLVNTLTVNGKTVVVDTTKIILYTGTEALYESTEYEVKAVGVGGATTQKVMIPVGNWKTSKLGIISHGEWTPDGLNYVIDGIIVDSLPLNTEDRKAPVTFTKEGKILPSSIDISFSFSLDGKYLITSAGNFNLDELSYNKLVISQETTYDGKPAFFQSSRYRK
jgi:hypothetical protein